MLALAPSSALLALLLALPATAQTWSKRFPGIYPRELMVEPNGDLVVVCRDSLLVLGPDGDTITRVESSNAQLTGICRTSDGGHAVCGRRNGNSTPYCARFDSDWNLLWSWNLNYFDYWGGNLEAIFELPSGDLRVVGSAYYSGSSIPGGSALHLRVDSAGGVVQDMRSACECEVAHAAMRTDGSYFSLNEWVYYGGGPPGDGNSVLELWDATGNLVSSTSVSPYLCCPQYVHVTSDGGCLVVASNFLRFDATGSVVLRRDYLAGETSVFGSAMRSVAETADGGAIVTGAVLVDGRWHGRLLKLDSSYDVEWDRAYGDEKGDKAFSLVIPYAAGFLAVGMDENASNPLWVVRTDDSGLVPGCQSIPLSTVITDFGDGEQVLGYGDWSNPQPATAAGDSFSQSRPPGVDYCFSPTIGTRYCTPAVPNSSGLPAEVHVGGSLLADDHSVALVALALPAHQFGYFLIGAGNGSVMPPGSQGNLCLNGGFVHRFAQKAQSSGGAGAFAIYPDTSFIPGHGPVVAGETWNFQVWFRDQNPSSTSNFTDAVGLTFQ